MISDLIGVLKNKPGFVSMIAATDVQIQDAEARLDVSFGEDYRAYVGAFGAAAFEGHELTGISKSSRLNVVDVTLTERAKHPDMPSDWYVIEQLHIDDVSIWQSASGEVFQFVPGHAPEKIADSLIGYVNG